MSLKDEMAQILGKKKAHPPVAPPPVPKAQDKPFKEMQKVSLERLKPPKSPMKATIPIQTGDVNIDNILQSWINDLDTMRSFVKLARMISPEFNRVNTRVSKSEMKKQFNTTATEIYHYDTALIREIKENKLFMSQKAKHNKEVREKNED